MSQPALEPVPNPIDTFGALHVQLKKALLASTDAAASNTMREADDVILDAITALNQADMHRRTAEFRELSASVNEQLRNLDKLKRSIDNVIADIALATKVVASINSAITVAAQVFPFP